jgi:hypothetical protein
MVEGLVRRGEDEQREVGNREHEARVLRCHEIPQVLGSGGRRNGMLRIASPPQRSHLT